MQFWTKKNHQTSPDSSSSVLKSSQICKKNYKRFGQSLLQALNTILKAGLKSYLMKKILLLPDFIARANEAKEAKEGKNAKTFKESECWQELLFDIAHHPKLSPNFKKKIDFKHWSKKDRYGYFHVTNIPLRKSNYLQNLRELFNWIDQDLTQPSAQREGVRDSSIYLEKTVGFPLIRIDIKSF